MTGENPVFKTHFWKLLCYLEGLSADRSLEKISADLGLQCERNDVLEVIQFLRQFGIEYVLESCDGALYIRPPKERGPINISFNLSEWISLYAHLPIMRQLKDYDVHHTISEKMNEVEKSLRRMDLDRPLDHCVPSIEGGDEQQIISKLESSIKKSLQVSIKLKGKDRAFLCFPHRIIYLEGKLSVIGEDVKGKNLISFPLEKILSVHSLLNNEKYNPTFGHFEIDDFIYAVRAINENEERLVLRVNNSHSVDLSPRFHFLGSPFITSNMEGHVVWAASVEVTSELFEWLYTIKEHIDILDPLDLKDEFSNFCEIYVLKNSLKSAS